MTLDVQAPEQADVEVAGRLWAAEPKYSRIEVFSILGESSPWPGIGHFMAKHAPSNATDTLIGGKARVLSTDGLSTECISLIREWMAQCADDHPYCNLKSDFNKPLATHEWLPKRLIEVGATNDECHLWYVDQAPVRYIALSYCALGQAC